MQENEEHKNVAVRARNRKKNKTRRFISNAKGFGKKGIYGRGTHIEDDKFSYFIDILKVVEKGFESLDDKVIIANNVFEVTTGEEVHLSSNQVVSKVIEGLIGFTSVENFERFQKSFSENFRPICSDKFASHILQKMIEIAFLRAVGKELMNSPEPPSKKTKPDSLAEKEYNLTTEFSEDHREKCLAFVLKSGKFLLNNLEDFIKDSYANHVMRTSILCLSGIHARKVAFNQGNDKCPYEESYTVPEEWSQVVVEYINRLQLWPQFPDFPYTELSSALLGSLCIALSKVDKKLLKHFGKKILCQAFLKTEEDEDKKKISIKDDGEEDGQETESQTPEVQLAKVFQYESSIRLLETLLTVVGPKLFTQLYAMLFSGRLKVLALNRSTNFAVQKLIENTREKVDFETIFTEISEHIEELLRAGHTGVVLALSAACLRLCTKQGAFVTAIQNALHTANLKDKSKVFFNCLLKLKPYEIASKDTSQFVHLHGSLIIQNILRFNKPIFLINCILEVPSHNLAAIFSTPNGSYIADVFLESKFVGEKSREKLIRYLEGNYIDMAVTKFGSRVVEKLFEASSEGQKSKIAKELADKMNQLNGTMFGRVLFQKFRLKTYQLSPSQWKSTLDKGNKADKLFKDILEK